MKESTNRGLQVVEHYAEDSTASDNVKIATIICGSAIAVASIVCSTVKQIMQSK